MKKLLLLGLFISQTSWALDLEGFISKAKDKFDELMGKPKEAKLVETIKLPKIPKVVKDAKSVSIYDKKGNIHTQGSKFNNLSLLEKRRYRVAFLEELFLSVNGSEASKDQLASSLNILEKGGSREGVYRSLVLGQEYSQLEGYVEIPNDKLVSFAAEIASKFMNKKFDKQVVSQLNLYGIKRVLCERMLEVLDAFSPDGKDLKSWYAILSSDLANTFPKIWRGRIRRAKAREVHFKWAGSIPLQHIKSEVIIKLHKVMNELQK